ncbi:MAG: PhnD/SsuA/transferrin family substrate-binding protein [Planctomycetes bacterium]|nr:PhnD/SsuA/transferrin family substrate-binding protein [Planctomycetota bacterium]
MTESPPSPRDAAAPLPALVSLGLLLALAIGVGVFAFARPAAAPEAEARAKASVESGLVEDVLTGRTTDANGRPVPPTEGLGSPGQPLRLRFVPSAEQTEALATIERLVSWLQERTGYAIEGRILNSYGLVIEELVQGRCDVAFLTAASYARARFATDGNDDPDDDIVAFLGAVRHGAPEYPGSDLAYRAALLVKNDSPIQGLDDLKDGVRVAMGSPTSGASSILPSALFQRRGITPEITRYGGGYPLIVEAVLQGAVDVGCIWWSAPNADNPQNDARITARASHPDIFETTRLVGFTEWIPNEPVVARASVPEGVRHTLARALCLYIATRVVTDEGRRELEAVGSLIGYVPATNEDFDPLLQVIQRAFANDPEGWADFQRSRK